MPASLKPASAAEALKIGAVAESSGLPVKTIRFSCDQGLLEPPGRSEGGYRLFDGRVLEELALIRTLKALEIPLADIGEILGARRIGLCTCARIQHTLSEKVVEIEARIEDLGSLRRELSVLLRDWKDCGAPRQAPASPPE